MPTDPNRVVEAVARGIYEGRNGAGCVPWSRLPKSHQEPYRKDAQAAIRALAENVSEGMVEAGARGMFLGEHPKAEWSTGRARIAWFSRSEDALKAALLAAAGEVE